MKTIKNHWKTGLILSLLVAGISSCSKEDGPEPKSSDKQITSFVFLLTKNGIANNVVATIDEGNKTITATMPAGTDITGLLPDIEIPLTAQISPTTAQDFTNPVSYTVSAQDGSKVVYTAVVQVALTQRQVLQAILVANPGNTLGWNLSQTADLGTLEGVASDVLGNITELDLSNKNLTTFNSEIGQLTSLTKLAFTSNNITSIPSEIVQLNALSYLGLYNNQLTSLPQEIYQMGNLEFLILGVNKLTSLLSEIGQLSKLKRLTIGGNPLTSIPFEIYTLTQLDFLEMGNNNLTSLPSEIQQLSNLKFLDIHGNQLSTLPSEIGQLSKLEVLYINDNQLTSLPPEIYTLSGLEILGMSNNKLTSLPSEIGQLTKLESLNIENNLISFLPPEIGRLPDLRILTLADNQLVSLPPELGFCLQLAHVDVRGNNLTSIPQAICNLTDFNNKLIFLSKDAGTTCKTISNRDALISIYSSNPGNTLGWGVENYPGVTFGGAQSIRLIEVKDKGVRRITSNVASIITLKLLDLRDNPLSSIAPEVCKLKTRLTILTDPGEGCN